MKIETKPFTKDLRHVTHYVATTKTKFFVKFDTYHYDGRYIRSVRVVERDDHFERCAIGLCENDKSIYKTLDTGRYSAKRLLQEISSLDESEVRQVAAANGLELA